MPPSWCPPPRTSRTGTPEKDRSSTSCSSSSSPACAGSAGMCPPELDALLPERPSTRTACRGSSPQRSGPLPSDHDGDRRADRRRSRHARRDQPLRDRPSDDPAHRARLPARSARVRCSSRNANDSACAAAEQFHHAQLLGCGYRSWSTRRCCTPRRSSADGHDVVVGTCNLEAWSLKRFFEIDLKIRSDDLASQFEQRFTGPAADVSRLGGRWSGSRLERVPPSSRRCRRSSDGAGGRRVAP